MFARQRCLGLGGLGAEKQEEGVSLEKWEVCQSLRGLSCLAREPGLIPGPITELEVLMFFLEGSPYPPSEDGLGDKGRLRQARKSCKAPSLGSSVGREGRRSELPEAGSTQSGSCQVSKLWFPVPSG